MRRYLLVPWVLAGCSPQGAGPGDAPPLAARAFPVGVAVASPLSYGAAAPASPPDGPEITPQSASPRPAYALATARINEILRGAGPASCRFDPALLMSAARDARCYGPQVRYEGHPDATGPADPGYSGTLPSGDVGLWRAEEPGGGEACAAAQLGARLGGVADQSLGALSGLASLVCTAIVTGQALPRGGSLDLTDEMNATAPAGLRFTAAALSQSVDSAGAERYGYVLELRLEPATGGMGPLRPAPAGPVSVRVELTHAPGAGDDYLGRLSYQVSGAVAGAPGCPGGAARLGSLRYRRAGGALTLEARAGAFCGDAAAGFSDGLVDARKKLDPMRGGDGWTGDFSIFSADFDPESLRGSYAYAWQAGPMDGSTRVLDVRVGSGEGGEGGEAARAFYGYGPDIASPGGEVEGMICSWAGPQSSHALRPQAQYQSVAFDPGRGLFTPLVSRLRYAPTTSCGYDGRGAFRYDSDGDGAVDTDPAQAIASDLQPLADADGDGRPDELAASGFQLPVPPPNL